MYASVTGHQSSNHRDKPGGVAYIAESRTLTEQILFALQRHWL
jgi:hypothetical protein